MRFINILSTELVKVLVNCLFGKEVQLYFVENMSCKTNSSNSRRETYCGVVSEITDLS